MRKSKIIFRFLQCSYVVKFYAIAVGFILSRYRLAAWFRLHRYFVLDCVSIFTPITCTSDEWHAWFDLYELSRDVRNAKQAKIAKWKNGCHWFKLATLLLQCGHTWSTSPRIICTANKFLNGVVVYMSADNLKGSLCFWS